MDSDTLSILLKDSVDWDKYFTIVEAIGATLNDRKGRFDKSDIFEKSLEECSQGDITWVDEIGWDHEIEY